MFDIFQYWQVNLILAIIFMVIFNQFYRLTARKAKDSASMMIIIFAIMCGVFVLFIPFFETKFSSDWKIYSLFLVAIFFYTINDRFKALGFKHLDVAVVSVLTQLSRVFLIVYGVFIFKEQLDLGNILGSILIIVGGILITYKKGAFVFNKYVIMLIIAAFTFATALFIDVGISKYFNLGIYLLMSFLLPAIIVSVTEHKSIANLKKEFNRNAETKKYYFVTGISFALAVFFNLIALRQGQVSIVAPLSSTIVLLNVLAGYFFLKEKSNPIQRVFASILVIIGVFLLV